MAAVKVARDRTAEVGLDASATRCGDGPGALGRAIVVRRLPVPRVDDQIYDATR
jgi:hypothetical protein